MILPILENMCCPYQPGCGQLQADENFGLRGRRKENWVEVIAHREDVFLEGIEIFREFPGGE